MVSFCVREHSLITEIQLASLVNHVSSACKIANHASCCNDRSRVTQIIWVQSRVTLQILGPSRVMKKRFATLLTDKLLSLKRNGNLSETIYKKIKPRHKEPPGIYGLPKINKPNTPLRPIALCINTFAYDFSAYLANILSPLTVVTIKVLCEQTRELTYDFLDYV